MIKLNQVINRHKTSRKLKAS